MTVPTAVACLLDGDPVRAARAFATAHGLTEPPTAPRPAAADDDDVRALADAVRDGRTEDAEWWARVAELWLAVRMAATATSCTLRARHLLNQGARPAPGLARRLSETDAAARAALTTAPAFADDADVPAEPEGAYAKFERLLDQRARAQFVIDADLRRRWYREGRYWLIVEDLLVQAAVRPLEHLLYIDTEDLVRCGRALHALGDRVSAYACFSLVVSVHGEPSAEFGDDDPGDPHVRYAHTYLNRSPGLADRLGEPSPAGHHVRGSALAQWLEQEGRQEELLAGSHVRNLCAGPMRGRRRTLRRQLEGTARRSGWFLPLTELMPPVPDVPDAAAPVGAAPPPPQAPLPPGIRAEAGAGAGGVAQRGWPAPESLSEDPPLDLPATLSPALREVLTEILSPTSPPALLRTVVGIGQDGGDHVLEIAPGSPALLLGSAGGAEMAGHIAAELVGADVPVLWARHPGPEDPAHGVTGSWHRLVDGGYWGRRAHSWVAEFKHPDTRAAVLDCLIAGAGPCPDPAGDDCLSGLLDAVCGDEGMGELSEGGSQALRHLAARVVEARARISFSGPDALRRTALLLERTTRAAESLREAIAMSWLDPRHPVSAAPRAVLLELPADDTTAAAVALALVTGSLIRTAEAAREGDGAQAAAADIWPEGFELKARPRGTAETDTSGDTSGTIADTPDPPAAVPEIPAPDSWFDFSSDDCTDYAAGAEFTSAWEERGMVRPHAWQPVCVLVSGRLTTVPARLLDWFGADGAAHDHALVVASAAASPVELRTAARYGTFLVGEPVDRQGELRTAFEVGAGVRLPPAADAQDADAYLVRCAGPGTARSARLVLWPRPTTGGEG